MKSILENLYYGQILPWEHIRPNGKRYKELSDLVTKELDYWQTILTGEEYARLEQYNNYYQEMNSIESCYNYALGFKTAVQIIFAALGNDG